MPPKEEEDKLAELLNKPAPDFELTDIDGNILRLSDQKDKVILLDFWEIWCGPCIDGRQKLNRIAKKYPKTKFELWSIVSDQSTFSKVTTAVGKLQISYRVMYGNKESSSNYFVHAVPTYVLVDKKGHIKYAKAGANSKLDALIAKLVN